MIHTLAAWPQGAQEAVRRSLARRYLIRRIQEIRQVRTSGNQLSMSVLTDRGPAKLRLEKPGEGCQEFAPTACCSPIPKATTTRSRIAAPCPAASNDCWHFISETNTEISPMPTMTGQTRQRLLRTGKPPFPELDQGQLPSRPSSPDTLSSDTPSLDTSTYPEIKPEQLAELALDAAHSHALAGRPGRDRLLVRL